MTRRASIEPSPRRTDLEVLWFVLAPACAAAAVVYAVGAFWPAAVLVGVALAVCVVMAPEIGFYVYFGWQSLDVMFLTGQSALTPGKMLALFLLLVYFLRPGRPQVPLLVSKPFVAAGLAFGCYGMFTGMFATSAPLALRFGAQVVVQVIVLAMAIQTLRARVHIRTAFLFTVVGALIGAFFMLKGDVSYQFGRGTLSRFANPNTTAHGFAVALVCIPAAWAYNKKKGLYLLYLVAVPVLLAATLRTGSRSALVAVLGSAAFCVLIARGSAFLPRVVVPILCGAVGIACVALVLHADILDRKSQARLERFIETRGSLEGEPRMYIWSMVLKAYATQPWGFGFGNTAVTMGKKGQSRIDAHSSYLSALVDGGPISLGLFLFLLWQLVRCTRRIPGTGPSIPAAILVCFLAVSCITHTVHFTKWFWIPATFCLLLAEQAERERRLQSPVEVPANASVPPWSAPPYGPAADRDPRSAHRPG